MFFSVVTELNKDVKGKFVKQLILEKLPEDNYAVLKYVIQFLGKVRKNYCRAVAHNNRRRTSFTRKLLLPQVMDRSDLNKMTSSNLAVVFGPNLLWSESLKLSLNAIGPLNSFTEFLLVHQDEIFLI